MALYTVAFAVAGFIVGLAFTVRVGHPIDLIYRAAMLPVLIATAVLWPAGRRGAPPCKTPQTSRAATASAT